jgi:phospholipase C
MNSGKAGAAFYIYSTRQPQQNPRRYTVSAARQLSDYWPLSELKEGHKLSIHGPNGYLSEFACDPSSFSESRTRPEIKLRYDSLTGDLHLALANSGPEMCKLQIRNAYDTGGIRYYSIAPGQVVEDFWKTASSDYWFDLSIRQQASPGLSAPLCRSR